MFERITQDEYYKQYTPTILSQPGVGIGKYKDDGPWVITLHNVVSDEECDELINLGGVRGYEQSYDVGKKKYDGTYDKVGTLLQCMVIFVQSRFEARA